MFEETAKQWVREMCEKGKFIRHDEEFLRELTRDYARQLEEIFTTEVKKNLQTIGKSAEYERMLLYDSQYINKYLNQTIAGYQGFRANIFDRAKKIILGAEGIGD